MYQIYTTLDNNRSILRYLIRYYTKIKGNGVYEILEKEKVTYQESEMRAALDFSVSSMEAKEHETMHSKFWKEMPSKVEFCTQPNYPQTTKIE